ncbi:hypothetical protein AB4259_18070 [Vibrio amylolyticus]|uniref:hypothetical protein n=1 Tax=Vibrio TaxID=662 RepID=UPI000C855CC4|nr:hypothetical protein [Vibrio sp. 10N.261.55.A7]PMJ99495.1 hypothetical protein BCU12_03385 [Vibrio sp. 10N.261.55.A7]
MLKPTKPELYTYLISEAPKKTKKEVKQELAAEAKKLRENTKRINHKITQTRQKIEEIMEQRKFDKLHEL